MINKAHVQPVIAGGHLPPLISAACFSVVTFSQSRQTVQRIQQDLQQAQQAVQYVRRQRDAYEVKYRVYKAAKRKTDNDKDALTKDLANAREAADKAWDLVAKSKNLENWADAVSESEDETSAAAVAGNVEEAAGRSAVSDAR